MNKIKIINLVLLMLLCLSGCFPYPNNDNPKAIRIESELKDELNSIQQFPNATLKSSNSSHKDKLAAVWSTYITNYKYEDIRKYYDVELAKHGWQFVKEVNDKDWGKDLGGKSAYYRKGEYVLTLQYAGDKANNGWTYGIDLSWGLHQNEL
jgi:hypothetical protein